MSYDVGLYNGGELVAVSRHSEGGTYVVGGTDGAELNVTYNYCGYYREFLDTGDGLYWLHGKKAKDTVIRLEGAVAALGTERDRDYWKATLGNAGYALSILLGWAKQHPDAVWSVS